MRDSAWVKDANAPTHDTEYMVNIKVHIWTQRTRNKELRDSD